MDVLYERQRISAAVCCAPSQLSIFPLLQSCDYFHIGYSRQYVDDGGNPHRRPCGLSRSHAMELRWQLIRGGVGPVHGRMFPSSAIVCHSVLRECEPGELSRCGGQPLHAAAGLRGEQQLLEHRVRRYPRLLPARQLDDRHLVRRRPVVLDGRRVGLLHLLHASHSC